MVPDQEKNLSPDPASIRADLEFMTRRWHELPETPVFELRAFKDGGSGPQRGRFQLDWMDDAVEWAGNLNRLGYQVYPVRNPLRESVTGFATDKDVIAAFYLWADCDDEFAAGNILKFTGPKWSAAVTTGRIPHTRVHIYWELEQPCFDMAEWRATQSRIAAHFGSDQNVINPSRIMRLAGTVTYPDARKRAKGYVNELTTIRTAYPDPRPPVTIDAMMRAFGEAPPARQSGPVTPFAIDTGPQPLDRERTRIQALSGQEWHNAVIRLVASYVAKGLSDEEVHQLTEPLTLAGYTAEQTRREVQQAIDGARRKGWTPQDYATPDAISFDLPAAETAVRAPSPERSNLEWFDDIVPALGGRYLVKDMLDQAAMAVVYGASNSGKTFFVADLAFHIAIGAPWRGRRVTQAAVLYLAAEGGRGIVNRIAAMRLEHGVADVPFALRRAGLDLLKSQADLQHVADLMGEVAGRYPDLPRLIVIDTLSRIMAGGDENSAQDMTALIRNIDAIREVTGAHIILVHHTGKDSARGARGHSSLRAATDTEIEISTGEDGGPRMAMVTKQREYQGGEVFPFTLKPVPLGTDPDGDDVSSCVVEHADADGAMTISKAKKGLGGNQKIIAETFDQMLSEGMGKPNPGGVGMPETGRFWCVPLASLRDISRGKMLAGDTRSAFNQAMRALTAERGLFCMAGEIVWRVDRPVKQ
jgi:hypothetical protein